MERIKRAHDHWQIPVVSSRIVQVNQGDACMKFKEMHLHSEQTMSVLCRDSDLKCQRGKNSFLIACHIVRAKCDIRLWGN